MGTEKTDNIKNKMTELLRNELSVLRAKARISQGSLPRKFVFQDRHIARLKLVRGKFPGQHFLH